MRASGCPNYCTVVVLFLILSSCLHGIKVICLQGWKRPNQKGPFLSILKFIAAAIERLCI